MLISDIKYIWQLPYCIRMGAICLFLLLHTTIIYAQDKQDSTHKVLQERREQKEKELNAEAGKGIDSLPHDWKRRITPGCNFSFSLGSVFLVDFSPFCGYRLSRHLMAGVGVSYTYYNEHFSYTDQAGNTFSYRISSHLFAGRLFAEYALSRNFYAHGELEKVNMPFADDFGHTLRRYIDNEYIGLGYKSYVGKHTYFQLQLLYNLNFKNNQDYNPNTSAFVGRVGFGW